MNRSSIILPLAVILMLICVPQTTAQEPSENFTKLNGMTREERARMQKRLDAFDAMDRADRNRIREFSDRIGELEPEAQARSLSAMRRYHAFYLSLPDDKRRALDAKTDPAAKLSLIEKYRTEIKTTGRKLAPDAIQISTLSPVRLRGLARHLIVYFSLDPVKDAKERGEFAKLSKVTDRENRLRSLIQAKGLKDRQELREKLQEELEEFASMEAKVRKNPILARRLIQLEKEAAIKGTEKADMPLNKRGLTPRLKDLASTVKDNSTKNLINLLDEQEVLRDLEGSKVDPAKLEMFEDALPGWARESFDDLPPDAARKRLKVLYRLVFPEGEEMQPIKAAPPATRPVPNTQPKGDSGSPF